MTVLTDADIAQVDMQKKQPLTDVEIAQSDKWQQYAKNANKYLSKFKGTPLTGDILSKAAKTVYEKHGVEVPLELALSQGQFETIMGTHGRHPENNPFNVYEYDKGTAKTFKNTEEGVNAYYDLMARKYLKVKNLDELLVNFVNTEGKRYASDKDYEKKVGGQVKFIKDFIAKSSLPDDFSVAFSQARKQGLDEFVYKGKHYTTKVK
jgi:hypothetical protein